MKEKEKSIESLAEEVIQKLSLKQTSSPVNFNVKHLAEELGDDVKRLYDICNVLEALGVVIKKKVNTFCWVGVNGAKMIETLRHLKTVAESEDLHSLILNKEVVTDNNKTLKLNLQVLTEKMMMLFLLLDSHESLTKSQLYSFIFRGAEENKASGILRISKVLKIVQTLGLLSTDWACVDFEGNKMSSLQRFRWSGPTVTAFGDKADYQQVDIEHQAVEPQSMSHSQEPPELQQHPSTSEEEETETDSQEVSPLKITYEIFMLDEIEERIVNEHDPRGGVDVEFIGGLGDTIIGRRDMTVKDEILVD